MSSNVSGEKQNKQQQQILKSFERRNICLVVFQMCVYQATEGRVEPLWPEATERRQWTKSWRSSWKFQKTIISPVSNKTSIAQRRKGNFVRIFLHFQQIKSWYVETNQRPAESDRLLMTDRCAAVWARAPVCGSGCVPLRFNCILSCFSFQLFSFPVNYSCILIAIPPRIIMLIITGINIKKYRYYYYLSSSRCSSCSSLLLDMGLRGSWALQVNIAANIKTSEANYSSCRSKKNNCNKNNLIIINKKTNANRSYKPICSVFKRISQL